MSGGASSGTDPTATESSTAAVSMGSAATLAADDSASASQSSSILKRGTVLGDRYRIEARIGAGGMGTVYRAEHVAIHKPVAIKVLAGDWGNRPKLVERFMQEARAASLVRHPSVVDITDFGHVAEGLPYYVMEYLEGETLGQRIAKHGRLSWAQARPFVLQILGALQAAHDHGVIHRDMKPDNCFIVNDGDGSERVKVLDFGIAKVIAEGTSQQLTQTGAVMGTAAYMSPEQAQSLELDARTDLYSVGVVLFEMLTGRLPFVAQGFLGVLTKHLTEKPPPLRKVAPDAGISAALERVVLRMLAKDRNERYASAAELAAVLRALDEGPTTKRRAWVMPVTVAGVLALGLVGWRAIERRQHRRGDRPSAREQSATPAVESAIASPVVQPPPPVQPIASATADEPATKGAAAPVTATTSEPTTSEPTTSEPGTPIADAPKPRSRRPVRASDPTALPERLDAAAIDRALRPARKQALRCGSEHAALPGMRVRVTFSIDASGKVTDATALKPNAMLPLGRCIAKAIASVRFPAALGPTDAVTRELVAAE